MADLPLETTLIFTDGACSGNPGPGGWGAIVLTADYKVTELGGGEDVTTNNRMELTGAIRALEFAKGTANPIWLYTDSTYVIRGITQWILGWQKKGWISANGEEVANKDLWQRLVRATRDLGPVKVDWRYVRGHTGDEGNERVDKIAVGFAQGKYVKLFKGTLPDYGLDLTTLPTKEALPEMKPSSSAKKAPAFSYLSYVNGQLNRHETWSDCERATKGRPGAKFKRANSAADEQTILKDWGLDPTRLKSGKS
jgi:ribonuclease HI